MKKLCLLLFVFALFGMGCNSSNGCVPGPVTSNIFLLDSANALTQLEIKEDQPAADAFEEVSRKLENKEAFRMNVYALSFTKNVDSVFDEVEKNNVRVKRNKLKVAVGNKSHLWHSNSGYEVITNTDKHYKLEGVSRDEVKPDSFYLHTAQVFMEQELNPETTGHYQYYPYKQKQAITSVNDGSENGVVTEFVDQIGVAYASMLDGWPVVGPGGKIYIHMLPTGEVVSHSMYRKIPSNAVDILTESDIKTPDEAYQELLNTWNLKAEDYKIIRKEFGYYFRGKNSIQNFIAPYYMYFLQFNGQHPGKVLMRPVLAIKGEKAMRMIEDEALEQTRKATQLDGMDQIGDITNENI